MTSRVFPILPASGTPLWFILAIVFVLVLLIVVFSLFAYSAQNARFELSDHGLRIRSWLYGRFIPRDVLMTAAARLVNLWVEDAYKPRLRTNGVSLPGYNAGWFRLRNGEKALVFMTDASRVVYIPTNRGYSLLVSPAQPEEFLHSIQELK